MAGWLAGTSQQLVAQAIATTALTSQQPVLNGRGLFTFPAGTVNQARAADIMSADHNANRETRFVLDVKDMRLVFFAQELYATADKALLTQAVAAEDKKSTARSKPLTDTAPVFSILSTPTVFDASQEAILVNSLLVRTADNTLFRIAAYINPAADKKRSEFITLSERVFQSLAAGSRLNDRKAHVETYEVLGTGTKLSLSLPADYTVTTDQKYDFQVFTLHHYASYGNTELRRIIIYAGHHPSFLFRDFDFSRDQAREVSGTFLGQPVSWLTFSNSAKTLYIKEQQVAGSAIASGLILHVGMLDSTEAGVAELTNIVAAVTLLK